MTYLANGAVGSTKYSGTYLVGTTTAEMNLSYGYTYNEDGSLSMLRIESNSASGESAFTYDSFGRLTLVETTFEDGVRYPVDFSAEKAYTYLTDTSGNTSALVSTYTTTVGGGARTYTFTYDVNGNITKIVDSAGYTCRYVYDDLGQLIREDDGYTNHTYLYTYDKAGNIIKKERYNYTGAGIIPVFGGSSVSYGYTSTNGWGDQLTSFGGNAITYDANGNPVQYYNGFDFTWVNGTELATAVNGNCSLSFSYDDNGVRVRKTVNGADHFYTVNGTQILTERWVADQIEHLLVYLYDASGCPIGMEYRNNTYPEGGFDLYLFETNLQGDVIGVYSEVGEKIINYTYDAWGNCAMTASANVTAGTDFAAAFNPFRYRGYYYDTELGLYYLNARYYDPNTGRFISADDVSYLGADGELTSYNLYAYCGNNPIMYTDPTGHMPEWLKIVLDIGLYVVSAVVAVVAAVAVEAAISHAGDPNVAEQAAVVVGVAVFGLINNATNAIYYNWISDEKSDLTPTSYHDGYISRWDRLDYTKSQTGDDFYNFNAWRFFSEYNFHMYAWFATGWADGKGYWLISDIAYSAKEADVDPRHLEGGDNWWRNIFYFMVGGLGI